MSIQDFSPLWEGWQIGEVIGRGTYGTVYKLYKNEFGKTYYSAVKHLSVPESKQQTDELYAEGMITSQSANSFFRQVMNNLRNEIETNYALKGHSHIVSYEDHKIIPKKDGVGYDIFIRMELLTSLSKILKNSFMKVDDVVKLGIDICQALETLETKKIIHRDIKPSNLFVGESGNYKLGDFGVARELTKTVSGMSVKGTFKYMAPEIQKGGNVNFTADIYSLGIVMYHLLNFNRAPFLPAHPQPISYADNERSVKMRMSGQALPMPANADTALAAIVLKACEYQPEKRWTNARAFRRALEDYQDRKSAGPQDANQTEIIRQNTPTNGANNTEVIRQPASNVNRVANNADDNVTVKIPDYVSMPQQNYNAQQANNFHPANPPQQNYNYQQMNMNNPYPSSAPTSSGDADGEVSSSKNSTTLLIVLLAVCVVLIVTIGGCFVYFYSSDRDTDSTTTTTQSENDYYSEDETQNDDTTTTTTTTQQMPQTTQPDPTQGIVQPTTNYEPTPAYIATKQTSLNFRSGPSKNSQKIGELPKGASVVIYGSNVYGGNISDDDWLYIQYNGQFGWASAEYVKW